MAHNIAIIAAGGKGSRLQANLPKQYHLLHDKPVLMHTIAAFHGIAHRIVLVIDSQMEALWNELCQQFQFRIAHTVVYGGSTRFASVKNGLQYIEKEIGENIATDDYAIAVHDAARPCVNPKLIQKAFDLAHQGVGNILAIRSTNSVRIGTSTASHTVNREQVWLVQTPQTFPAKILFEAFRQEENVLFTDEATVVEKLGHNILIVEGDPKNIKITYPEDFAMAQTFIKN